MHAKWSLVFALGARQPGPRLPRPLAADAGSLRQRPPLCLPPLAVMTARPSGPWLGCRVSLIPDILRLATALGHLPPCLLDVGEPPSPLVTGWCYSLPLWGSTYAAPQRGGPKPNI
jgi:hypothetical protein